MKIFRLYFRTPKKRYNDGDRIYIEHMGKEIFLMPEGYLTVVENDVRLLWNAGGGIIKLEFLGEMPDSLFNPVLSEPDFIDEKIRSKKGGEVIGFQG